MSAPTDEEIRSAMVQGTVHQIHSALPPVVTLFFARQCARRLIDSAVKEERERIIEALRPNAFINADFDSVLTLDWDDVVDFVNETIR